MQGKEALTHDQKYECEKEVTRFIKGTTDQIHIDGNLHKVYECFNIFKRILSSKNLGTVDNDQTSSKSESSSYQDQMREKDNHICMFYFYYLFISKNYSGRIFLNSFKVFYEYVGLSYVRIISLRLLHITINSHIGKLQIIKLN